MSTTLPLFWHLSSVSKQERIDASIQLVGALEEFQSQFVLKDSSPPLPGEDEDEGSKADMLDALNAQDVSYSIRRLVRGLASPRESSRLGFAVALTELLSRIDTITCSQIVSLIIDSSQIQGSMTGQEIRDVLFARLFGLTAVIRSGVLLRSTTFPSSASFATLASSLSGYKEAILQLIALGEKKSWLREGVWWSIILAVEALGSSEVTWKCDAIDATVEIVFVENKEWSPEKVALAVKLQTLYPKRDWKKHLLPSFKNPDLLSNTNLVALARILKESSADEEEDSDIPRSAAGTWRPQVHFVWDVLLEHLLPGLDATTPAIGSFAEFFRIAVDESLFASASSPERKYWGFQIFQKALQRVSEVDMPMLFTKNFMRSWINHLSQKDRYLHKIARQTATDIQSFVQRNPKMGFALILQLTGVNGTRQFDKLTKTKTVESILTSMDADGIKHYLDYLLEHSNEGGIGQTEVGAINSRRLWILDQLTALIRNGAIPKSDDWIKLVLDWFVVGGLFVIKKSIGKSPYRALHSVPHPALSDDFRRGCRAHLLNCLAELTSQPSLVKTGDKTVKTTGVASDGQFWISKVLETIHELENDHKHVSILADIYEGDQALRTRACKVSQDLRMISGHQQEAARGAELLLMASVLQQYCNDGEQECDTESLEACIDGAIRMFLSGGKKGTKSQRATDNAETLPEPIDILVDAIIGFLEKSTAYMRTVGNQVFSLLSGSVRGTTVDLILMQLERISPAQLAEDGDEEMPDDHDENDSLSEHTESECADEVDDPDDEKADLELRMKIEDALRVNVILAATGESDGGSDEDLMDDDQMMAIDDQLAEIFRSRAREKKADKGIDVQREATHFKNRVLDLVDLFAKNEPSNPNIVRLILPLVELIAGSSSDERQFSDKAKGVLTSRIGKSKDNPSPVDVKQVSEILEALHRRARKVYSSDLVSTLSQCSLYLSRLLLHSNTEDIVLRVYRESLVDFATRKASTLHTAFFQDFIRRSPSLAWSLRDTLLEISQNATNIYRQCQVFQLLQLLISQLPAIADPQEASLFFQQLRRVLIEVLSTACDETATLSAAQMKDLFKLALLAIRQTKRVMPKSADLLVIWEPVIWDKLHKKLATTERFKASTSLQAMCQQTIQISKAATSPVKSKGARLDTKSVTPSGKRKKLEIGSENEVGVAPRETTRKKVKKVRHAI